MKSKIESFAVIDTETDYINENFISVGVVIADKCFNIKDKKYYVNIDCSCGMYSDAIDSTKQIKIEMSHKDAMDSIIKLLNSYNIKDIFAYNASFDWHILKELKDYKWHDIMAYARDKKYNKCLTEDKRFKYTSAGKLRKDFGVEKMYRLLTENKKYKEKHNAIEDATDELVIMKLLNIDPDDYAIIIPKEKYIYTELETITIRNNTFISTKYVEEVQNVIQQYYYRQGAVGCANYLEHIPLKRNRLEWGIYELAIDMKMEHYWTTTELSILYEYYPLIKDYHEWQTYLPNMFIMEIIDKAGELNLIK